MLQFLAVFAFSFVLAADDSQLVPCGGPGQHSCTICDFFEMTKRATNYIIFGIIPAAAAFLLLLGGSYLIWTKGDPGALTNAKAVIKVVIYGFIGVFAGWVFINTFFMAIGIAEWNGLRLDESWWKISAKCSKEKGGSQYCGDGRLQDYEPFNEQCDPGMKVSDYQNVLGWTQERAETVASRCKPKGDPEECTAVYCGDGIKQSNEKCDASEGVQGCMDRTGWNDKKCLLEINYCNADCKKIPQALCGEGQDKSKLGMGCWLSNKVGDPKYCQRGKYICDDNPDSPTYDKIICKELNPPLNDECCLDRGENLDKMQFDIVRIRDYVQEGSRFNDSPAVTPASAPNISIPNISIPNISIPNISIPNISIPTGVPTVPCMSTTVSCDKVCAKMNKVCIGVGLINWQKNKCVSVVHHNGNDCNLSENLQTNTCRSEYCTTTYICCEGGDCGTDYEPCCKKGQEDPVWGKITGTGAQFSVGETACYCR